MFFIMYIYLILSLTIAVLLFYVAKSGYEAFLFLKNKQLMYLFISFSLYAISYIVFAIMIINLSIHNYSFVLFSYNLIIFFSLYAVSTLLLSKVYVTELFNEKTDEKIYALSLIDVATLKYYYISIIILHIVILINMIAVLFILFIQILKNLSKRSFYSMMVLFSFFLIFLSYLIILLFDPTRINMLFFFTLQLISSVSFVFATVEIKKSKVNDLH
ncbi:MAG: hypothetical protein ACP5MW_04555 [Thermoplasmata archaeon]